MGTVTIFCVFLLYACPSLRSQRPPCPLANPPAAIGRRVGPFKAAAPGRVIVSPRNQSSVLLGAGDPASGLAIPRPAPTGIPGAVRPPRC